MSSDSGKEFLLVPGRGPGGGKFLAGVVYMVLPTAITL